MPNFIVAEENGGRIDRTQPAELQGLMESEDWIDFCKKYDSAIDAGDDYTRFLKRQRCLIRSLGFLFFCAGVVFDVDSDGIGGHSAVWVGLIVMFFSCRWSACTNAEFIGILLRNNLLEELCRNTSQKHQGLLFHFKNPVSHLNGSSEERNSLERYYIEVSIIAETVLKSSNMVPSAPPCHDLELGCPQAAVIGVEAPLPSNAQRLLELNSIKELLTEIEYNKKREEILSSF